MSRHAVLTDVLGPGWRLVDVRVRNEDLCAEAKFVGARKHVAWRHPEMRYDASQYRQPKQVQL